MKTPEEMAEEYCEDHDECEFARDAVLAGYKAAMESTEWQLRVLNNLDEVIKELNEVD